MKVTEVVWYHFTKSVVMCGISGRFNLDGRPVQPAEIVSMRDVLHHRGPDDSGLFTDGPIGLGHRRLAIIDLAGGHQPVSNEDGTVTVVFNGEIYNFAELRSELLARGHVLTTHSDTEVIVHMYEEMGAECVRRFRGMFAFALWDGNKRQLVLARDRLGIKPLYYTETTQSLLFASEIKGILAAEDVVAELDSVGLRRYLTYRHTYGVNTLFKGVRQLPPGSCLIASAGRTTIHRYWDVPEPGVQQDRRAQFLPTLEESVRLRMISDVPIGAFLSGGLDSSVITALMARRTEHVRTFSIGFVPGEESELEWAKRVADICQTDHHELVQGAEDFFALLQRLIWHHDEPLTFPASIPLYLLSRESKRHATVMLAGEGADELLGGYTNNIHTYWLARLGSKIPFALRSHLRGLPLPKRLAAAASRAAQDSVEWILGAFRLPEHGSLISACRMDLPVGEVDDLQLLEETGLLSRRGGFLDRLLFFQLKTYLIALLMKQDKMSMAASIETRVPYLDHHLVELAFGLPDSARIRGRTGKYLLKRAAVELLPRDVVYRRKQGFPVPIASWFRAPGNPFTEVLLDPQSLRDGLLDPAYVRARVHQFLLGAPISIEIWSMLNLELWRREFMVAGSQPGIQRTAMVCPT